MLYNQIIKYMGFNRTFSKITVLRVVFLAVLIPVCFACNNSKVEGERKREGNTQQPTKSEAAITVSTGKTIARQLPSYIQATGSFVADETSDVAPKVAGKVVNVYADAGQFVSQGSVIARLDDQEVRQNLRGAEVRVKQAEVGIRQAEARLGLAENGKFNSTTIPEVRAANANVEQLQAELRQAEANVRQAEVNEKRYRELVESGDVATITYEQFRTARDTARTARDTAQARVKNGQEQLQTAINAARQNNQAIKAAEANLEAARVEVATTRQTLDDYIVRAPFSGFVSNRSVAVGEFASSSTPILTLLRVNPIKLQIQVAESDIGSLSLGRGVSAEVEAYKDRKFAGTVTAINPALNTASRSTTVEAQIENSNNLLRSGMFATVKITKEGSNNGIFAPKASIYNDQSTQSYRIFVIQEGIAKLRVVQLGTEEGDMVQILSGVEADETVAISNLEQLYEGAKVAL
jgi:multidrug efflux pump subunit AcrA (membrane-fusion protein)